MSTYNNIIARFNHQKILVIGDIILDQYIKGSVYRISPEAPVPIVFQEEAFYTPGGAANVAKNLRALGARVSLIGRIGQDMEGEILKKELKKEGIDTKTIFVDKNFPTILKTRILAHHQQILRIDREQTHHLDNQDVIRKIFNFIKNSIDKFDAIILSDYGKGIITPHLVSFVRDLAIKKKRIITIDPKVEHFSYYRQVTSITPNLKEVENAIRNIKITSDAPHRLKINTEKLKSNEEINLAGKQLLKYLNLESLLITLGEHGMRLFEKGAKPFAIDTKAKEVFDVTGAGDTVISVFTLALAAGSTKRQAAEMANFAAGIKVGKMGAATVSLEELKEAIKDH